jgi:prevent-host-death family protein
MAQRMVPIEATLDLGATRDQLAQAFSRVASGQERIVVENDGKPVAAIISIDEYQRLKSREDDRDALRQAIWRFSSALDDVSDEELDRELAKANAEVRAEMLAERESEQ